MSGKEESFTSSRKLKKSFVTIFKTNAVGGISFAKESPEFGTEIHHHSFLKSSY